MAFSENPLPETHLMSEEGLILPLEDPKTGMVNLPEPALRLEQKLLDSEVMHQEVEVDRAKLAELIKANQAAMAQLPAKHVPAGNGSVQQNVTDDYELDQRIELIKNMNQK